MLELSGATMSDTVKCSFWVESNLLSPLLFLRYQQEYIFGDKSFWHRNELLDQMKRNLQQFAMGKKFFSLFKVATEQKFRMS